jgi:hypothetical protein
VRSLTGCWSFLAKNCVIDAHPGKLVVTCVFALHAVFLCTVGRTWFRWFSEPGFWTFGERNLLRSLLFDEDGGFRPAGVIAFDAAIVLLVWVT